MTAMKDAGKGRIRPVRLSGRMLFWLDKALVILAFLLFAVFPPDLVLMMALPLLFAYLYLSKRTSLYRHLLVAIAMAFLWMAIGSGQYGYNKDFIQLYGVTLFPFFAWASGLFAMYLLFSHHDRRLRLKGFLKRLLLFSGMYIPLLLIAEKVAYELLHIHNVATAQYAPLPICGCLHAPPWMQAAYLLMGPLFFIVCYLLKLEDRRR